MLGMSITGFARVLGASFVTVSRWENGHTEPSGTQHEVIEAMMDAVRGASARELREISKRIAPGIRGLILHALIKKQR